MARRRPHSRAGTIGAIAVGACCMPCIVVTVGIGLVAGACFEILSWETPRTRRLNAAREAERHKPRLLEPRLDRHLTIGRPERLASTDDALPRRSRKLTEPSTRTDLQVQSPLFTLPLEVRRQIYALVIGGYVIHAKYVLPDKMFGHTRCKGEACDPYFCKLSTKPPGAEDEWGVADLMALPKSCRRIYSEAIETLYVENIFEFENLNQILLFSLAVLPERFRSMRRVEWTTFDRTCSTGGKPVPWLICCLPQDCCCISCLPPEVFTDMRSHNWVVYMWQMRFLEQNLQTAPAALIEE